MENTSFVCICVLSCAPTSTRKVHQYTINVQCAIVLPQSNITKKQFRGKQMITTDGNLRQTSNERKTINSYLNYEINQMKASDSVQFVQQTQQNLWTRWSKK